MGATNSGRCRSCGQVVRWAKSATSGKPMPLNPDEDLKRGNVLLDYRGVAFAFADRQAALAAAEQDELLYDDTFLSHHATCPHRAARRPGDAPPVVAPVQELLF